MVDINVIIKTLFENPCNDKSCDACKLKDECKSINQFIKDIKDKGLTDQQVARAISLFIFILREQKYIADFGSCQDSIIKTATTNEFEVDMLINRYESILNDKDKLKPVIAVFPKYAKDMIINIVNANTEINHFIAQHIIDTSNVEYKEIIKMVNQSVDNNKQDNKFKNISDDEIYAEIKRRKANKSAK
jgi:hypothetical protein